MTIDDPAGAQGVDVHVVRPLRAEVRRAGRPPETAVLPGDDHPLARHVALRIGGEVMAVGTVIPEAPPWAPELTAAWRLRGMATRDGQRGRRLGDTVLRELIVYATEQRGDYVWCAARVAATTFYARAGLVARGEIFATETVEHIYMCKDL
ncbi:MAG: GNAT family N-acetyltransferase [Acidimicrobiales bacterium]